VINNLGNKLVLSKSGNSWGFTGGEIDGGTISSPAGSQLDIASPSSSQFTSLTLDGVTLGTNALITNSASATFKDGLTLTNNAVIQMGATPYGSGSMIFAGTQTLTGTGTLLL